MYYLVNSKPNDVSRPLASPTDRQLFLASAPALTLASIPANFELAKTQAAQGVSINQPQMAARSVVILIDEWQELNDNIKTIAEDIRTAGLNAIAIDLFNGLVTTNHDKAKTQTKTVKDGEANATIAAWVDWVKATGNGNGKVTMLGWCFGACQPH